MSRILVLNNVSQAGLQLFGDGHEISSTVQDPEAIVLRSAKLDTDLHPNLIGVARAGAGVNNVTVDKASERGICVFNTPGANANAVAELVFATLGLHARKIDRALRFAHTLTGTDAEIMAAVEAGKSQFSGFELAGKTLGIIGLGKIGVLVANAGINAGMRVIGFDAYPTHANMHQLSHQVQVAQSMEAAIRAVDILTVHVPYSDKTRHIIGAPQLALMRPGGIALNYSRDGIFDDAAVLEALSMGRLDTFITDFPTGELLANDKVICTPHLGASTAESEENCAAMACRQLDAYLRYAVVSNSVNFPTLEAFPADSVQARVAVICHDAPSMITAITGAFGAAGVNIQSMAYQGRAGIGYALVDLGVDIEEVPLLREIRGLPDVLRARLLRFPL